MGGIGAQRGDLLQRNGEFHLQVSDVLERDGYGSSLRNGQLAVMIECGGSGYLKIGPALDALEDQAEGLGAAFYWTLIQALYRVMWIYDHDDAVMYEERLIEYANEDDEENRSQYEFPEVEKALPTCIQRTLKEKWRLGDRRLLRAHGNTKPTSRPTNVPMAQNAAETNQGVRPKSGSLERTSTSSATRRPFFSSAARTKTGNSPRSRTPTATRGPTSS